MMQALIGSGGHAREVMFQMGRQLTCFVSSDFEEDENVYHLQKFNPKEWEVMIAIGDPRLRELVLKILPRDTCFFTYIHPTALVGKRVEIGKGSFIGAYSILTENIRIGDHSILNRSCQIGHDSICGDFLSMMPGSIISGNVKTGKGFYLGTNSAVKENISICDDVKIGLMSGVVKDIEIPGTYVGSPVKMIVK